MEAYGEINQIKVASEIGYTYSGQGSESVNELIKKYTKDKSIDLSKKVVPGKQYLERYEQQGKDIREEYLNKQK